LKTKVILVEVEVYTFAHRFADHFFSPLTKQLICVSVTVPLQAHRLISSFKPRARPLNPAASQ